jgi:chromosomal replication initiator protein
LTNLLLITGSSGVGKSHLLYATTSALSKKHKVLYLKANDFICEMVNALQNNTMQNFKRRFKTLDVLIIDNIDFLIAKDRSQEELLYTTEKLLDEGKVVIFAGNFNKGELRESDKLLSITSNSLSINIGDTSPMIRYSIIKNELEKLNMLTGDNLALLSSFYINGNVSQIKGLLKSIIYNAKETGIPINEHTINLFTEDVT